MLTLEEVKEFLHIDYSDENSYLSLLLIAAKQRAMNITGKPGDEIENDEIKNAILEDVATMYQNRGDINTINNCSIATYRRYCRRPMF